ncbi:MAG: GNAT family N-acetyltransferase [Bacteroidales bacterium]|nr:GNAT family N-acetyltransferase [Bacteroidales bacterium]
MPERIQLRALEPEDLDLLYKWENDTRIWTVSNTIAPFSRFVIKKYLENSHLDIYQTRQLRLMIDLYLSADKPVTIGAIDLFDFDPFHNRAGVGILIAEYEYQGKGYASLALNELIEYAFSLLHLHQLYCNVLTDNKTSLKLFINHGFRKVGIKKEWIKTTGTYKDEYTLQLINNKNKPA